MIHLDTIEFGILCGADWESSNVANTVELTTCAECRAIYNFLVRNQKHISVDDVRFVDIQDNIAHTSDVKGDAPVI